jgi:hypothetical protein
MRKPGKLEELRIGMKAGETMQFKPDDGATVVFVKKELEDVLRASIGGTPEVGFYLTYRGEIADVISMLSHVLECARKVEPRL